MIEPSVQFARASALARRTVHFTRVDDLTDPGALSTLLGTVASVASRPIGPLGHSGATHERLQVQLQNGGHVALVLKRIQLSRDWTALASTAADANFVQHPMAIALL